MLRYIECRLLEKLDENGWVFQCLGAVFNYYAKNKINSRTCQKLVIYYLTSCENWQKPKCIDGVAEYFEVMENSLPELEKYSCKDMLKKCFPFFYAGIKNAFDEFGIDGNHVEVSEYMKSCDFMFSERLKKINKEWSLRWRYEKHLEYFFHNIKSNKELRFLKWNPYTIRHKDYLDKFYFDGNLFKITETKSDCYWVFDLQHKTVSYVSPRAEFGLAHNQYNLAVNYLNDRVIPRDLNVAKELLEKAVAQGFKKAEPLLKKIYAELEAVS